MASMFASVHFFFPDFNRSPRLGFEKIPHLCGWRWLARLSDLFVSCFIGFSRQSGVLGHLDDWLILAQYRELDHWDHVQSLGLRFNAQKSVLTPQQTTFLVVQLDSLSMQARLFPARVSSLYLPAFQAQPSCCVRHFSRASGAHGSLSCAAFGSPSYSSV